MVILEVNLFQALKLAREEVFTVSHGMRPDKRQILILFTDGGSDDFEKTLQEAALVKEQEIEILVIAITDWVNMVEINAVASDPDDYNVFLVQNFPDLLNISEILRQSVCACE